MQVAVLSPEAGNVRLASRGGSPVRSQAEKVRVLKLSTAAMTLAGPRWHTCKSLSEPR